MMRTEAIQAPPPRLTVELVPPPCHGRNCRSELRPSDWDWVRKICLHKAGHRCEVCGGVGDRDRLECHEVWEYDDERLIQTLTGLQALCPACHEAKHYVRATTIGRQEQADAHLAEVNGWTPAQIHAYVAGEVETMVRRSGVEWRINLDKLCDYSMELVDGGWRRKRRRSKSRG
jgi:hypothetical protein